MNLDLSAFDKRVLLAGAGFSHNWGGYLATKIWEDIYGHPRVKMRPAIGRLMVGERSFERVLGCVRRSPFETEDAAAVEQAISDTFDRMDSTYRDAGRRAVADSTINDFLSQFCRRQVGQGTGFIFSLNQDLLFERIYGTMVNREKLTIPGIQWISPARLFPTVDAIPLAVISNPMHDEPPQLERRFNLIKLHGSVNWRSSDGSMTMVVGDHKTDFIASSPLLAWYWDIFETVLCAGDVRLMVIGYSWSDDHINSTIVRAVSDHGLQVYFWDLKDPRDMLAKVLGGDIILRDGFLGKASGTIEAIMPAHPYNPTTEEYKRIVAEFF